MRCLVVFAFVLIFSGVAGEKVDLHQCLTVAITLSGVNPGGACAYVEDAVRCGINNLGLLKGNTTEQSARTLTNGYLRHYNCSLTFDDIFNASKAKPERLELQRCIDTAMLQNLQDPDFFRSCPPLEQSITCGIGFLKVYEEDASDDIVKSFRSFANDELSAINCDVTFDDILNEIKADPETLNQRGCNHTTDEGFQGCDHARNNTLCGIKMYKFYEDAPPNDYKMVIRATYDWDFGNHRCNITFDDILNEVKAKPELLDDQSCPDIPNRDGVTICDRIEEGVRCGIKALELYKDEASNDELMYGRQLANRYLTPFRCKKTFDDLLEEEKKGQTAGLDQCLTVAITVSGINPESACSYVEDAVRCGINNLGLLKDNTTEQLVRIQTNGYLRHYNCSLTFDDIFDAVKAKPERLESQRCIDTAMLQNVQDPDFFNSCPPLEQSITCGIGAIKVYEEDASDDVVKSFRSFANDQLSAINCDVTFDDILNEIKANPETLKQRGCNYTAVEGSQGYCDHAKNNTLCGIKLTN